MGNLSELIIFYGLNDDDAKQFLRVELLVKKLDTLILSLLAKKNIGQKSWKV